MRARVTRARLPLDGLRVVVTRAARDADTLASRLEALGAMPILCPSIEFGPPPDAAALDRALAARDVDWVVFTSATGVRVAFDRVASMHAAPAWASARVAAVGPASAAALREGDVAVDFVPDAFVGEALAEGLPDVKGRRVLLIRAQEGRDVLRARLAARGAEVLDVAAYTTVRAALRPDASAALDAGVDAITFTAASTVEHFAGMLGARATRLFAEAAIVTIGPVTSDAVRALGQSVAAEAGRATLDGLVDALASHFACVMKAIR